MTVQRWMLVAITAILAALLGLAATVHHALERKSHGQMLWREKVQEVRTLTKNGNVIPSVHLLKDFEKQRLYFQDKLDVLLQALKAGAPAPEYGNPLEFKGDLNKIRRALLSRAEAMNIALPPDIGFKEFIGKEIPPSAELENLAFQLANVRDFLEMAMDSGILEIRELTRGAVSQQRVEPDEETPFYRDFAFQTQFFCSTKAFTKMLAQLQSGRPFFVLENADIRLRADNALEVRALFRGVSFSPRAAAAVKDRP